MKKWTVFVCGLVLVYTLVFVGPAFSQDSLSLNAGRLQIELDSQGKANSSVF